MNRPRKGKKKDPPAFVPVKFDVTCEISKVQRAIEHLVYVELDNLIVPVEVQNEVRRILHIAAGVAGLAFKPLEDYQTTLGETRDHA